VNPLLYIGGGLLALLALSGGKAAPVAAQTAQATTGPAPTTGLDPASINLAVKVALTSETNSENLMSFGTALADYGGYETQASELMVRSQQMLAIASEPTSGTSLAQEMANPGATIAAATGHGTSSTFTTSPSTGYGDPEVANAITNFLISYAHGAPLSDAAIKTAVANALKSTTDVMNILDFGTTLEEYAPPLYASEAKALILHATTLQAQQAAAAAKKTLSKAKK
jgi:hypothetical protein